MTNVSSVPDPIVPSFPIIEVHISKEHGTYVGIASERFFYRSDQAFVDMFNALDARLIVETSGKLYRVKYVRKKGLYWSSDILFFSPLYKLDHVPDGPPTNISFEELRSLAVDYSTGPKYTHSKARARLLRKELGEASTISDIFEIFDKE